MPSGELCKKCLNKQRQGPKEKSVVRIEQSQYVYDAEEVDFVNEHQSKVYISYVDVNPWLKFGIRAHHEEISAVHCFHSVFDPSHKDFLSIWANLLPTAFFSWELISIAYLGLTDEILSTKDGTGQNHTFETI